MRGYGAAEESRTLDLNLGKVALYQLSYSRMVPVQSDDQIKAGKPRIIAQFSALPRTLDCMPCKKRPAIEVLEARSGVEPD